MSPYSRAEDNVLRLSMRRSLCWRAPDAPRGAGIVERDWGGCAELFHHYGGLGEYAVATGVGR